MARALREAHPVGDSAGRAPARFGSRAVPVPATTLPPAELRVLSDSTLEGQRRVRFLVRAPAGAYSVGMQLDTAALATLDGKPIDTRSYREGGGSSRWRLEFVNPPESGVVIGLEIPTVTPRQLELNVRTLGVPIPLPQRPPGFIASQSGDYSTVVRRLKL
jgi:hypothetical protein